MEDNHMAHAGMGDLLAVVQKLDRPELRMVDIVVRRTCHIRQMVVVEVPVSDHVAGHPMVVEDPTCLVDIDCNHMDLGRLDHLGRAVLGNLLAAVVVETLGMELVAMPLAAAVVEDEKSGCSVSTLNF